MVLEEEFSDDRTLDGAEQYRRRKTTSVLAIVFTDIANSTALREQLGEVRYEALREEYDGEFSRIIERDEAGAVVKSTGDGALAVFSEPSVAVERCVQAQVEQRQHPHFKLRIGIDMGQVTVKAARGIVRDVFGRHVNRAARIQSLAEPGHILTSFHVFDCAVGWLKSGSMGWHNHGEAELKGFDRAVSIYEAYDPQCCSPQKNESWRRQERPGLSDVPMFSRREPSRPVRASRPVRLDTKGWEALLAELKGQPLEVFPPKAVPSMELFSAYSKKIRHVVALLEEVVPETPAILWVDDFPENNIREHQILRDAGCTLDLAISTEDAQDKLAKKRYLLIITDMRRGQHETAGLDLLRWNRRQDLTTPIVVYASPSAIAMYGEQANTEGALLCTAGVVTLLDGIHQVLQNLHARVPRERV